MAGMRWTPRVVVTLLVRIGGLALAVAAMPFALERIVNSILSVDFLLGGATAWGVVGVVMPTLVTVLLAAGGAYCFLSGRWVIARLLRGLGDGRHCSACGYDLQGVRAGSRCPECGAPRG